jgi:hypothetical protein
MTDKLQMDTFRHISQPSCKGQPQARLLTHLSSYFCDGSLNADRQEGRTAMQERSTARPLLYLHAGTCEPYGDPASKRASLLSVLLVVRKLSGNNNNGVRDMRI